MTTSDVVYDWQAELEQQALTHNDIQQMLMSDNEALQQQIIKLRHDLVRDATFTYLLHQLQFTTDEQVARVLLSSRSWLH